MTYMYAEAQSDVYLNCTMWRDSYIYVTWLNCIDDLCTRTKCAPWVIYMRTWLFGMCTTAHGHMIHSYIWRIHIRDMTRSYMWRDYWYMWHDSFSMTHVYVYNNSCKCAPWLVHMRAMTHEYMCATAHSYVRHTLCLVRVAQYLPKPTKRNILWVFTRRAHACR